MLLLCVCVCYVLLCVCADVLRLIRCCVLRVPLFNVSCLLFVVGVCAVVFVD